MQESLNILFFILSAVFGLAFGSFLNVCIYRIPIGKFFSSSRSYCPKCGAPIRAYDNIPVLSYIILGGKCRSCKQRISLRYPLVELLNCALWTGNYAAFGMTAFTLVADVAVSVLIVVAMIDLDTMEIPDSSILTLLILGLITFAPVFGMSWQEKLIGAFCISVPLFVIALLGGMGLGDVKLFFVAGLLLGWKAAVVAFMIAAVSGAVVSVIYLAVKRIKDGGCEEEEEESSCGQDLNCAVIDKDPYEVKITHEEKYHAVPFGPFIALGLLISLYFGDQIIGLYRQLLGI